MATATKDKNMLRVIMYALTRLNKQRMLLIKLANQDGHNQEETRLINKTADMLDNRQKVILLPWRALL